MIHFLIHRPIAVTMTFLTVVILGTVAGFLLPVSLMPDIDIPQVTVQISAKNTSARQLETTVAGPLRAHLMQVAHLADIRSETRDETSIITLSFDYGTNINFAFVEVNEKIDHAINALPKEVSRPKAIKASATDIPVYYLNLTLKNTPTNFTDTSRGARKAILPVSKKFEELSDFARQVICKRLEQLQEVAMADVSGLIYSELLIIPDMEKIEAIHISLEQLEELIKAGNIDLGNLLIRDGQYQYNVRFGAGIHNKRDIEGLFLNVNGRLLQLRELCRVVEHPQARKGLITYNGKDAISIAVIKQADSRMEDLKENLESLVHHFNQDYPSIEFTVTRDQTELLEYSISNLSQNLVWGAILSFIVLFLFLRDFKSPWLVGISMPASLIISLILFYLFDISINIISLSGLVLGLGMMIDNSIIVIDNITQHRARGSCLVAACVDGAGEVFRPMLSSMLTSCAVFIPLIFLHGISGALFYDQAIAVAIGHFASLLVSVTLIPVYYRLLYRKENISTGNRWLSRINTLDYEALYEKSFRWVMRHQVAVWTIVLGSVVAGLILYADLPRSRLPALTKDETLILIDWNQKITVEENNNRVNSLLSTIKKYTQQSTCMVGEQQYLLDWQSAESAAESVLYIKGNSPNDLALLQKTTENFLSNYYPDAVFAFEESGNLFNLIFPPAEPPLIARLRPTEQVGSRQKDLLPEAIAHIRRAVPEFTLAQIPWQESLVLRVDPEKLILYGLTFESLYKRLSIAFNENEIFVIKDNQDFVPVVLGGETRTIREIVNETYIPNEKGNLYPLKELIRETRDYDLKTITAGKEGEFFPISLKATPDNVASLTDRIKAELKGNRFYEVDFRGSLFSNEALIMDLSIILMISLVLLYLILASQFESLLLPLIVLIEVPIDVAGSLLFLKLFGSGINLMSLIGIIVMGGIIINDSILKLDTARQLQKEGYSLLRALLVAGQRRLKPILMTALITVLAMSPLIFTSGLGAELQKPLSLALTGGMIVGTLASLYFIPLCYYYLNKNKNKYTPGNRPRSKGNE